MNITKILFLGFTGLLSACSSVGQLDSSVSSPSESESIFVLGVAPESHRVSIFPGGIIDGHFYQNPIRTAAVYSNPKQGFVVGKASAGDVLAITNVRVVADSSSVYGADFKPCGDMKTMVFEVPKGKVLYLGSVDYKFEGKQLVVQYRNDIEAAHRHIDANFPALKGKLEPMEHKLLPTSRACGGTTLYLPIYR